MPFSAVLLPQVPLYPSKTANEGVLANQAGPLAPGVNPRRRNHFRCFRTSAQVSRLIRSARPSMATALPPCSQSMVAR
jgi:hypothetical protein